MQSFVSDTKVDSLQVIDKCNISSGTDFEGMFYNCKNITVNQIKQLTSMICVEMKIINKHSHLLRMKHKHQEHGIQMEH